jgi:hypothetical protein
MVGLLIGSLALLMGGFGGGSVLAQSEDPDGVYEAPSPSEGAAFGSAIAAVGDVDGHGRADLVVGVPHANVEETPNAGRVYLLSGATGAVLRTVVPPRPQVNGVLGSAVAGIGDVTGDDVPDLLVGAVGEDRVYLFDGADGTLHWTQSARSEGHPHFGRVAAPGDVTGDGTPDVLVGASTATVDGRPEAGRAYLLDGRDGTLLRTLSQPAPDHGHFGYLVAGVGDVDGDGTPDAAVGATSGPEDGGTVYVYSGADGTVLHTVSPPAPATDGYFGYSAVGVRRSDGPSGLLLGARVPVPDAEHAGRAHLFSPRGRRLHTFAAPAAGPSAQFGSVVATVTDPGDSSQSAVLVGAPRASVEGMVGAGRVYRFALP